MKQRILSLVFLTFFSAIGTDAQSLEGGGIVYGDDLGVGVAAPAGWIFDSNSGVNQGLHAVMYPDGSSWKDATEVMYVSIAKYSEDQGIDSFVTGAIQSLQIQSPELKVEEGEKIQYGDSKSAQVRIFSGDQWGNKEAVAYADLETGVAIFVLSSRTVAGFDKSYSAFREMVGTSFFAEMKHPTGTD